MSEGDWQVLARCWRPREPSRDILFDVFSRQTEKQKGVISKSFKFQWRTWITLKISHGVLAMRGKNLLSLDLGNIPRVAGQSDSPGNMPPVLPARPPSVLPTNTSPRTEWHWIFLCIQMLTVSCLFVFKNSGPHSK